ncbi:hypothetical protein OEZ85_002776 [Tetradesmus obliquus]|uniref:Pep3/Vps18 beta-propeller domain-containing protein n=1 Tax=Tetradesmus obliquus TaxID=3088 RepID=A0ABY8U3I4_TETOB|nr:hypothetical protein OEZ85_002776 [Tetradesmus obliquus]
MDLLDDFDRVRQTFAELSDVGKRLDSTLAEEPPVIQPAAASYDLPSLSVEVTVRQAARGRGQVVAAACAADTLVLATSKGFLLRYQWDEYGNEKVSEVELTKPDNRIKSLYIDPRGAHVLACVKTANNFELLYVHSSWAKPRQLSKLKGLAVTAVGWQKQPSSTEDEQQQQQQQQRPGSGSSRSKGAAAAGEGADEDELLFSTGDIILGSGSGSLQTTCQEARAKREGAASLLLDFKDKRKAMCSIEQEQLPGGRRVVMMATPSALYIAAGGPGLQGLFGRYAAASVLQPLLEVESPSLHSQLRLLRGSLPGALPSRFAWLVGGLLLHGHLLLAEMAGDAAVADGQEYVGDMRQLALAEAGSSPEDEPHALVCSTYHYLLLYGDRLAAINQVSGKVVSEISWGPGSHTPGIVGQPLGLLQDAVSGAVTLWSGESLHEVAVSNEDKDMWRIYLEHQDYANALKLAAGSAQRDIVYQSMGADAAAAGDFKAAGAHYGRIVGGKPPFEELALLLVEAGDPEALQIFLNTKLQVLGPNDKAQATMVAAWLTELLLDTINRDLLAAAGQHTPAYKAHVAQLRSFLSENAAVLNWGTTTALLEGYGRLGELEGFAAAKGDQEALLEYLMRNKDGATRALGVLRKPSVGPQLVYKFAPELLAAAPQETVDFLIAAGSTLDPRQLLPALVRFGEPDTPAAKREQALRYVSFALDHLRCNDSAVANLAVALLSLDEDEGRLLDFMSRARTPLRKPLFDAKYALRLAKERNRRHACVKLLCELGLYEDAVPLALAVDLGLAKAVANSPEDDDALRRKLWLSIAKHVVQGDAGDGSSAGADGPDQAARIKMAVELLKEAGGLLKIEDILPFFPDFVTIDAFKGAITDSLTRYNRQIEELKGEMDEATEIAEAVRRDLKLLQSRTAVVSSRQVCVACNRCILDPPPNPLKLPCGGAVPPFYLFPTGQAFHVLCAAAEVVQYGGDLRAKEVKLLLQKLSRLEPAASGSTGAAAGQGSDQQQQQQQKAAVAELAAQLEAKVGCEDPWNGELLVRLIDMPFVAENEKDTDSWKI